MDSILNENIVTGTVYHVVASSSLFSKFNMLATKFSTTSTHIKIINTTGDGQRG